MKTTPRSAAWAWAGAAALAAALAASGAWGGERGFAFRDTPFMIHGQAEPAAQAFVAEHIRPGMPLAEAIARAEAADARCRRPADPADPVVCSYSYQSRHPSGDLDEVEWRIEIVPGPKDTVASAEVARIRHGL